MVAAFLRAEIDSERWGPNLRAFLERDRRGPELLRHPDLAAADDNEYRRRLLEEHRAYARREGLFAGFPRGVAWFRAIVTREQVLEMRFIHWDWWLEITDGSRLPRDAARKIRAGEVAGITREEHKPIAEALGPGSPELIALTTPEHSPIVLVEGHVRLTAAALYPERVPAELEILLGVSDEAAAWSEF
jgi:hypothetical protein